VVGDLVNGRTTHHKFLPSMIIECPACSARAKLPDSKEGAKVRCIECNRVYVARASGRGAAPRNTQSNSAVPIGIGAAVVALTLVLFMMSGGKEEAGVPEVAEVAAEAPKELVDDTGWDSVLVKRARKLHDQAFTAEEFSLQASLSWAHVYARTLRTAEEPEAVLNLAAWEGLTSDEVDIFRGKILGDMQAVEPINLVGSWKPFDGNVIEETDNSATLRLAIEPRTEEIGEGTRNIEWKFVKDGNKWKAWSWERWRSAEELKTDRIVRKKSYDKKTLSDGSKVIEAEPGPVAYMDETTLEQRKDIDGLVDKLMDPYLPAKELSKTRASLELHGKHAVPPLLTKFYELNEAGFPDMDSAIQAQMVHSMLSDLTGYVTTFSAHEALGATKERRDSGVRQWFGWYTRKFNRFEGRAVETDNLEDVIEFKSDRERREYEKTLRTLQQQADNKNPHKSN
jgi:predicted Zn finger-like uncharacterized protein